MAIGKTPVNQLNALPLQDANSAAAGGVLQVIGGTLLRYFDGPTLLISGTAMTTFASIEDALVTPYLDLRGCTKFIFSLSVVNNVAARGVAMSAIKLKMQVRMGIADTPPVVYVNNNGAGSRDDTNNALWNVTNQSHIFSVTGIAGEVQRAVWAWESSTTSVDTSVATVFGSDIRFIVTTETTGASPPAPGPNSLFTANLWASS